MTRPEGTPVPIPNTKVKIRTADGTWLETARESRWLPEPMQGARETPLSPALFNKAPRAAAWQKHKVKQKQKQK